MYGLFDFDDWLFHLFSLVSLHYVHIAPIYPQRVKLCLHYRVLPQRDQLFSLRPHLRYLLRASSSRLPELQHRHLRVDSH